MWSRANSRNTMDSSRSRMHKRLAHGLQEKKQSGMSCIHCGERFEWKRGCYIHMYYCDEALHNIIPDSVTGY